MAKLSKPQIRELAKKLIRESSGGIRYSRLLETIATANPETNRHTIHGSLRDLQDKFPKEIAKPSRGLFTVAPSDSRKEIEPAPDVIEKQRVLEASFYQPFADWLRDELDEVTIALPLGGAGFQKKWGTPDVIGVYKPLASHRIKFDLEIVTAEIKIDPQQPIVAFGQAVAYRLFSNKTYILMPESISEEDFSRLEALSILLGLGFVTFDATAPSSPNFRVRVSGQRFTPDMFYVNEFAERIYQIDADIFNQLFG